MRTKGEGEEAVGLYHNVYCLQAFSKGMKHLYCPGGFTFERSLVWELVFLIVNTVYLYYIGYAALRFSLHVSTIQDNYNGKYSSIIHKCRKNRIFAVSSPSTDARTGLYCCR